MRRILLAALMAATALPAAAQSVSPTPVSPAPSASTGVYGQQTLNSLTNSANSYTNAAGVLLASQEVCGYPHTMLASAVSDLMATGDIDNNKVVAIAYQLSLMAKNDMRVKDIVCSGAMKMVNENETQRRNGN
jgi:hypothetical protein